MDKWHNSLIVKEFVTVTQLIWQWIMITYHAKEKIDLNCLSALTVS